MGGEKHSITIDQIVRTVLITVFIAGILWYLAYQARNLIAGPNIELTNEPSVVQHDRTITLEGRARNIIKLSLNGKEIYTDEEGYFKQPLILETGYTIMSLSAYDRYGRTVSLERSFVYKDDIH